jgi:hypothetical protein
VSFSGSSASCSWLSLSHLLSYVSSCSGLHLVFRTLSEPARKDEEARRTLCQPVRARSPGDRLNFLSLTSRSYHVTPFWPCSTYLEHFSSADPFHDPSPRLSFLGNALVSLAPLSHKVSFKTVSPIFCRYTTEAIGSVRITLSLSPETSGLGIASLLSLSRSLTSESEPPDELPRLAVGSRLSFSLTVDNVRGISPLDFKSVHAQISAASFLGDIASDETIISNLVQLGSSAVSELCLRKKFNIGKQTLYHLDLLGLSSYMV